MLSPAESAPQYPDLPEPFAQALREAVRFILANFDVLGIIAAGSVVRGEGHQTSDLDIYVIQRRQERQRIHTVFAGVPTQFFVNPPAAIPRYFKSEMAANRPVTAHMLATGFVVLDRDPFIEQIRQQAREMLATPPTISEESLTLERYMIADTYENALDMVERDSAAAVMILSQVVYAMLRFYFRRQRLYYPRDKDLLRRISELHPELGQFAREFYQTEGVEGKRQLAERIADLTIERRGHFEWQSTPEAVE